MTVKEAALVLRVLHDDDVRAAMTKSVRTDLYAYRAGGSNAERRDMAQDIVDSLVNYVASTLRKRVRGNA